MELPQGKTLFEPYRTKMVEPLRRTSPQERRALLEEKFFNLFLLPARAVTFDFLTDSGTNSLSNTQWSAMMMGDESYAGSDSFYKFEKTVQDLTGFAHVLPTHQGRAGESLLMQAIGGEGKAVLGNTHFLSTRANIEASGAEAIDMPSPSMAANRFEDMFRGNVDLDVLKEYLNRDASKVVAFIMTVTNNSVGGQPVSLENIRNCRALVNEYNIPFFLDAARFAENAYFIKQRESKFSTWSIKKIAQEMFSEADGALMSGKKDGFCNIGGFLALNDGALAEELRNLMIITEGFPTYGGLAGRDLEAMAVGLQEILDEEYLEYRVRSVEYLGAGIEQAGFPVIRPFGGHVVYIDAAASLPQLAVEKFPALSLSVGMYEGLGLRSVEVGSVSLGKLDPSTGKEIPAPFELVGMSIPRRVYSLSHMDYIIEMMGHLSKQVQDLPGYEFTYQAPTGRQLSARFKQLSN